MATTYEKIQSTTLGSAASTISFNSISSAYTDLRLVMVGKFTISGDFAAIRFNGDTGSNYSDTEIQGSGSSASSTRHTGQTNMYISDLNGIYSTSIPQFIAIDIFSYTGSTYKTALIEYSMDLNGSGYVGREVGLWRSTSAITSITALMPSGGQFATGYQATLYGILKA